MKMVPTPPQKRKDLEVPRNGNPPKKKPSVKKLVLVKWRKKEWSKIIGSTSIPFQPAFPYWKPPPFLLLFSFAVPFCFQQKNTLQKALVFETHHKLTSEKQHSSNTTGFLGNFPDFPVFPSPVFQLRMKISWVFFLPWRLFRLLAPFWSLLTLQLGAWKDAGGILVLLGKKGSPKPPPPKKNIGKNNWGTKKLYKEKVRTFWW